MTFEEQFPSLTHYCGIDISGDICAVFQDFDDDDFKRVVKDTCLDKQRVREAFDKLKKKFLMYGKGTLIGDFEDFEEELGL